jgi:hypothetical protein
MITHLVALARTGSSSFRATSGRSCARSAITSFQPSPSRALGDGEADPGDAAGDNGNAAIGHDGLPSIVNAPGPCCRLFPQPRMPSFRTKADGESLGICAESGQ